ncbi:MAG: hypothetical protein H5U05_10215 [Candidatus Aminicenantes bacterium]|nr:hypothetical protein [Candidatus Aminicenantes bacterium]
MKNCWCVSSELSSIGCYLSRGPAARRLAGVERPRAETGELEKIMAAMSEVGRGKEKRKKK